MRIEMHSLIGCIKIVNFQVLRLPLQCYSKRRPPLQRSLVKSSFHPLKILIVSTNQNVVLAKKNLFTLRE